MVMMAFWEGGVVRKNDDRDFRFARKLLVREGIMEGGPCVCVCVCVCVCAWLCVWCGVVVEVAGNSSPGVSNSSR